jgi:nucleoside-diphosphate-sugar epimerase
MRQVIDLFSKKYKKALVTGGAGFIGSHICEELVKTDLEVISLDDLSAGKSSNIDFLEKHSRFKFVKCDVSDKSKLSKHLEGVDIIFHNAASKKTVCLQNPARDLEVNAKGTLNLLQLSVEKGIKKFVHASTGSVYGEAQYFPQDEMHPLNPTSYYGVSKLAGEKYVNAFHNLFGLDTTVLRYFHVYGPRQESNEFGGVVSIFVRNLVNEETPIIFGDGTQQRSFTFVKDIVYANLTVAVKDTSGEIYNCASGINITIQELCDNLIVFFGKKGKVKPRYEDWVIGDIKIFDVSNEKIESLGVKFNKDFFSTLKDSLKDIILDVKK